MVALVLAAEREHDGLYAGAMAVLSRLPLYWRGCLTRSELICTGAGGLGRRVGVLLEEKARKKALRLGGGIARPAPTDVGALRS